MAGTDENSFPVVTLKYRQGDLIIKQGDYGISIYRIVNGEVLVYQESTEKDVPLATLGPGDVLGEISFLKKGGERRSASAKALEETVLEVWHPSMLSKEYQGMPPMLKYITDQLLTRFLRMNHLLVQLTSREIQQREAMQKEDPLNSRRRYYRKAVDMACHYRPVDVPAKVRLPGRIKDISLNGIGIEIRMQNTKEFSHVEGDSFVISTALPNGKNLELKARIVSLTTTGTPGRVFTGMSVTELSDDARKLLGFFLMP